MKWGLYYHQSLVIKMWNPDWSDGASRVKLILENWDVAQNWNWKDCFELSLISKNKQIPLMWELGALELKLKRDNQTYRIDRFLTFLRYNPSFLHNPDCEKGKSGENEITLKSW